jgi:hypothetical protein
MGARALNRVGPAAPSRPGFPVGDAGRGYEDIVAAHHVVQREHLLHDVADVACPATLVVVSGVKPTVERPTETLERTCRQHTLGRPTDADHEIDVGLRDALKAQNRVCAT